jgi:hypothetical protein
MIDKIVSPVILIITVIFFSIILYTTVFSGIESDATINREQYGQEYGNLLSQSLFAAQENDSGMTYEILLIRALREIRTTINVGGREIDVKQKYTDAFDQLVGPGNYYLEVKPLLQGVAVSYILDGSPTMLEKRATVNASLPDLITSLRQIFGPNASVVIHLYILKQSADQSLCGGFYHTSAITCEDIGGDMMYSFLRARGISAPAPAPYRTFAEWMVGAHIATSYSISQTDWASGAMYASIRHTEDELERLRTNKHVIVTAADELTTTSKADECFGIMNVPPEPIALSYNNLLFCQVCNATCPYNRTQRIINATALLLQQNEDLYMGFYSFPCDYTSSNLNNYGVTNYSCHYLDNKSVCALFSSYSWPKRDSKNNIIYPTTNANLCEQNACSGCKPSGLNNGEYCFHRNCDELNLQQMQQLANATGGQVLNLDDLSMLTTSVKDYFQNMTTNFNFTIGVKDTTRDRYAIDKDITFPTGERIHLTLWLYDKDKAMAVAKN